MGQPAGVAGLTDVDEGSPADLDAWNDVAETYAGMVGVEGDLIYRRFEPFIWRHLGEDLTGSSVLDVGCGHGWLTALMSDAGADAVGIDGSTQLLDRARQDHPYLRFEFSDLVQGLPASLEKVGFDRVVANMVVMDLPDLDALGASLRRCVRPRGRVILTLLHPAFFMQSPCENPETGERYRKVTGYLAHEQWWVESFGGHRHYHRPLNFYVNWLAAEGFGLIELFEPPVPLPTPEPEWSEYERWFSAIPTMLGLAFTPISSPSRAE